MVPTAARAGPVPRTPPRDDLAGLHAERLVGREHDLRDADARPIETYAVRTLVAGGAGRTVGKLRFARARCGALQHFLARQAAIARLAEAAVNVAVLRHAAVVT